MRIEDVAQLLAHQERVVSRQQLLRAGATSVDVERWVRRRELTAVHAGVYVDHTGPPSWMQLAWAGTLLHAPAVLDGSTALRAWGVRSGAAGDDDPIELLVRHGRRVDDPDGVRTRVSRTFDRDVLPHASPPRTRLDGTLVTVAAGRTREDARIAVLADAVQSRRTTVPRLRRAVLERPRLAGRTFLLEVLTDVEAGALSPLERRYLRDVERTHGLPRGERQVRRRGGGYDDIRYPAYGVRVELDGVVGHTDSADRWADLERDLDTRRAGDIPLRAGWRQVLAPCRLAALVGSVLQSRGWRGRATCPRCDRGGSAARGADNPHQTREAG